jgi:hypothetical protein
MVKIFQGSSLIFIYPEIESIDTLSSYTQEPDSGLLEKGLDLLKGARGLFKKD